MNLRTKLIRLAHSKPELRPALLPLLAQTKTASEIGQTILQQMGGARRIAMMTGAKNFVMYPNGVRFSWPSKQPSKGNEVKVTLDPSDTYTVEFFNVRQGIPKSVKKYTDIYAEDLISLFERQTGYYLRMG